MVEVVLRVLFVLVGLATAGWMLVAARAFATNFANFEEREAKHPETKPIDPNNKDKILV